MIANLVLLALPLVITYLAATIWHRRFKQFANFPQPKPSLLWGHLRTIHEYTLKGPPQIHHDPVFAKMAKDLGNPPLMFLDLRPVSYPMVLVTSHEVAEQVSRASKQFAWSTPKSPTIGALVRLIGPESILMRQNEDWKQLRKRFNPGFAPQHLMTLLPCILDKTSIFLEQLDRYASSGKEFPLNKLTINLTFDIIGAITMDVDFDAQHSDSSGQGEFIKLYDELLKMYGNEDGQLPWWMFPRREWRRYKVGKEIDRRLETMIRAKHAGQQQQQGKNKARDILSLSLQGSKGLSSELLAETRDQIKTFLFAGHDTTGILLAWLFYELSRSPHVLKAVRDELDNTFGPDPDPAAVRGKLLAPDGEELINRLPYLSAVIKEVLRVYPPAGTARMARPGTGFTVRTPDGQSFCLDGAIIYNCATIIQRDRTVYGDTANDFVPERWLGDKAGIMSAGADEGAEQQNEEGRKFPPGAWRPFERGPRNCIGQDLATIEARVIVAVVARQYDFVKVGLGELDLDEKGQPALNEKGQYRTKSELYNTAQVTAKPVDAMRMTVRRRA
ncbi:putative sterigmatocystin biosynthesis P450 monooxygenase stcS [Parachaetomium inaequale]|uniref:Sterigmatocystin biosynthesis P450 monooxygenase stcS n=1 Tax=Parachaetomium inaequale TaxID=2588326 RepID=A0AAN6SL64_9PEZI|nr:putative sterigmatocystin biosynthesis P450 monooxygenase stcS [Parachaetomium inaequale]